MAPKKSKFYFKKILSVHGLTTGQKIAILAIIIGLMGAILAAIIEIIPDIFKSSPPEFKLINKIVHPDSTIKIEAINLAAKREKSIIFEIDDFCCHEAAYPLKIDGKTIWHINLYSLELPNDILSDGHHYVRFGFSQNKMSERQRISFDSKPPETVVGYTGDSPTEKRIFGKVMDDNSDQSISVEVAFQHQEKLKTTQLPVRSYVYANGRKMYEFEYHVQNIPQISKNDPYYNKPFFAIKVNDEAGNEFYHTSNYSAFIAEGMQTFGTSSAEILFQKIDEEKIPVVTEKATLSEKKEQFKKITEEPPLITLRFLIRTPSYVQLNWNRLPKNLRVTPEEYVIMRRNKSIGTFFDTTFTDRSISPDSSYPYQIFARGRDNKVYLSNILSLPSLKKGTKRLLRSIATSLTEEQVKSMLKDKGFVDHRWNENGKGYENNFEIKVLKGDKVVIDHTSCLIWQQSGSNIDMTYDQAKYWIEELNKKNYAGYRDWRLPTLEEAMSLMEPVEKNGNLYINPVFDRKQQWIWTSDIVQGTSCAWVVFLDYGYCNDLQFYYNYYVRAVRLGDSSHE